MLVQPPGYPHSQALLEAGEYLQAQIIAAGHPCQTLVNGLEASRRNIILGGHLLSARNAALLPAGSIVFNSEQLDNEATWTQHSGAYREVLNRHWVWEYSSANLPLLGHRRADVIPFLFNRRLRRPGAGLAADGPLLFYGALTPRREALLAQLRAAGLAVETLFGVYGAARDAVLFRSLAVLNLHNRDDARQFEPLRCFYPLINGVPVFSEACPEDPTAADFRPALFESPAEGFAASVATWLADRPAFLREAGRRTALFSRTDASRPIRRALARYLAATG